MSWNYRLVRRVEPHKEIEKCKALGRNQDGMTMWYSYGIYEVYYTKRGYAHMVADEPEVMLECEEMDVSGAEMLAMKYKMLSEVFRQPVLDFDGLKEVITGKKGRLPSKK